MPPRGPQEAALTQDRNDPFAELKGLLEMRISGQHELVEPEPGVVGDAVGDLMVAPDERRPRAPPDQADAGPQVGRHLQLRGPPAVERAHALLALRPRGG